MGRATRQTTRSLERSGAALEKNLASIRARRRVVPLGNVREEQGRDAKAAAC